MRSALLLACLLLSGCIFGNISSAERLRDSVIELNDQARWARIDLAIAQVAPSLRREYRATHRGWGHAIRVADTEILGVEVGEDHDEATSTVTVRWYSTDTMMLAETTLKQKWRAAIGGYRLIEESVSDGDPRLLAEVPSSGGEDTDASAEEPTAQASADSSAI
ncbi:MAG: hypothetical protein GXP55_00235 [Deltaproteobacteria bacterium]|nr:hypothetical protein [Deltaproteobacteria bacterium]